MKLELAKALRDNHPQVFQIEGRTPMAFYGFEVGDGWYDILDAGFRSIGNHLRYNADQAKIRKKPDPTADFRILQIKEKFGCLRFYVAGFDETIRGIIDMMESMSEKVCEQCGAKGELRKDGWLAVRCDKCEEKHVSGD